MQLGTRPGLGRFARSAASVMAANYAAIGVSFFTSVVLTRLIGAGEYGHLALLLTGSQVLSFFVSVWTLPAIVQFGSREFAEHGSLARTFWSRTVLTLPWLAAAAAMLAVLAGPLGELLSIPPWGAALVFAHFVLSTAVATASSLLQAMQRMPRYAVGLVLDRALALAAILVLARFEALDAVRVLACLVLSSALVAAFLFASIGRRTLAPIRAETERIAAVWRFSLPIVASSWVGLFGSQWLDYLVIRTYLPLGELGLYALAYQLAGVLQQMTSVVATLLLPRYSLLAFGRNDDEVRRIVGRIVPYWLIGYALALCAALVVVPPAIGLLFGEGFSGAVPAFRLLVLASIALAIHNTFTPILTAHEKMWPISFVVLASVLVNVGLDLALVPAYGIAGAAAATVVAYGTSALAVLAVAERSLRLPALRHVGVALPVIAAYLCSVMLSGPVALGVGAALVGASLVVIVRALDLHPSADLPPLLRRAREGSQ